MGTAEIPSQSSLSSSECQNAILKRVCGVFSQDGARLEVRELLEGPWNPEDPWNARPVRKSGSDETPQSPGGVEGMVPVKFLGISHLELGFSSFFPQPRDPGGFPALT